MIRVMKMEDYDQVYALWSRIHGFGLRSVDDSREGIRRFGKEYGLTDPDDICYLPCRTSITGEIFEEPDWELLRTHAKVWFQDVESCAVCEIYGIRNGGVLEKRAAEILEEETGLPVVCASSLFSGLSSLERAAGALLNAGLMVITREFLDAVRTAFRQRGIRGQRRRRPGR